MRPSEAIVAFVQGIPFYLTAREVAKDLAMLGRSGACWPKHKQSEWMNAIKAGLANGIIVTDDKQRIGLPRVEEPISLTQGTLFEVSS